MTKYRTKAYLLLLVVSLIWGFAGPVIKLTLNALSADTFLLYRFLISSIIALIFFLISGFQIPKEPKTRILIFVYGILVSSFTLGLLFWGTSKTSLLDMSIIQVIGPLGIIIFGYLFLKERVTKREKIGAFIAFLGSLIIVIEPVFHNNYSSGQIFGNILIFLSLITNAVASVILKKLLRQGIRPMFLSNLSFIIGFLSLVPLVLIRSSFSELTNQIISLPIKYHLGVLYMAVFSGTIAYTLGNIAQKSIEISEAALFSYLHPLFSALLAIFILRETPTSLFMFSSVIIAIGIAIAEIKKGRIAPAASH